MKDDYDHKRVVAEIIAKRAGAIVECQDHSEIYYGEDSEGAYRLGNSLFLTEFKGVFEDRKDMTDTIKSVIDDSGWECGQCHRNAHG